MLFALFDDKFKVVEEIKERTLAEKGEERFTAKWREALGALERTAKKKGLEIVGIGAGCAGVIDEEAKIIRVSPNIPFLEDYPIGAKVAKIIDAPFALGNDVQTGLHGELQRGAARNFKNVIAIFIGTGIGGALSIDGKVFKGATGLAGEIGHYLTDPMGPLAGSERRGTLDDVASRGAIAAEAAALAAKQWAPYLAKEVGTDVALIRSSALAKAIAHGDEKIEELVRSRARTVGIAVANLVDFLSADMVVLGGGMVDEMADIIVKEVEKGIREYTVPLVSKHVKVVAAALKDHAVTIGAACLAWDVAGIDQVLESVRVSD